MAAALPKSGDDDAEAFGAPPMSEINVTPLVDVMLVLLIVFMVAAPLMAVGVPINLPKSKAAELKDQEPPVVVSIDGAGKLYVGEDTVTLETLVPAIGAAAGGDDKRRIHVRGDQNLPYGRVVEVMGLVNRAGYARVALISEAPEGS